MQARRKTRFRVFAEPCTTLVNNPDYYLYYFGVWEPRLARTLERLVRPGDICVDAGANIGWYTVLLAKLVGHGGQVHAFEPDARAFSRLVDHIALNDVEDIVSAAQVALGRERGVASLNAAGDSLYSSLYAVPHVVSADAFHVTAVSVMPLTDYLADAGVERLDMLKIDVEGAEWDVLRGVEEFLGAQ
ncbi:MAG: FkbM family methyltransferase, partial [Chloroflexota bacterium]|nr:FkbM family methyltransferase [Chloroflexota bacterium]